MISGLCAGCLKKGVSEQKSMHSFKIGGEVSMLKEINMRPLTARELKPEVDPFS